MKNPQRHILPLLGAAAMMLGSSVAVAQSAEPPEGSRPGQSGTPDIPRETGRPGEQIGGDMPGQTGDTKTGDTKTSGTKTGTKDARMGAAMPLNDAELVNKIHAANRYEIELGAIAKTKGSSEAVRDFGEKLVDEHSELDKEVTDVAQKNRISFTYAAPAAPSGAGGGKVGEDPGGAVGGGTEGGSAGMGAQGGAGSTGAGATGQGSVTLGAAAEGAMRAAAKKHSEHLQKLGTLTGAAFDRRFLEVAADRHAELASVLRFERGRMNAHDKGVVELIDEALPKIEAHRDEARKLLEQVQEGRAS